MKFILVVIWTANSLVSVNKSMGQTSGIYSKNSEWQEVAMQEFDSNTTCETAAKKIKDNAPEINVMCLKK